jgi:hypothetical protein
VCCGTKRLTEIACPPDCTWLASAREHPAASIVRQQQRDIAALVQVMRDFSERQSQLFLGVATFLVRYEAPELHPLVDDDVAEALEAAAATYETAARGLIYEHRPASMAAERLLGALKPLLAKAGQGGGSAFDRDAAAVLRRTAMAVSEVRGADPQNRHAFVELLARVIVHRGEPDEADHATEPPPSSRLILP